MAVEYSQVDEFEGWKNGGFTFVMSDGSHVRLSAVLWLFHQSKLRAHADTISELIAKSK
jgi:hypothetical protein